MTYYDESYYDGAYYGAPPPSRVQWKCIEYNPNRNIRSIFFRHTNFLKDSNIKFFIGSANNPNAEGITWTEVTLYNKEYRIENNAVYLSATVAEVDTTPTEFGMSDFGTAGFGGDYPVSVRTLDFKNLGLAGFLNMKINYDEMGSLTVVEEGITSFGMSDFGTSDFGGV